MSMELIPPTLDDSNRPSAIHSRKSLWRNAAEDADLAELISGLNYVVYAAAMSVPGFSMSTFTATLNDAAFHLRLIEKPERGKRRIDILLIENLTGILSDGPRPTPPWTPVIIPGGRD
jgi:hypothetical protein